MIHKIIFVYNADSDTFSAIKDTVKKIFKPSKYQCSLCMATHGIISVKKNWKTYLDSLLYVKEFLHRDEFLKAYPEQKSSILPLIATIVDGKFTIILDANDLSHQKNPKMLIEALSEKLNLL